MPFGVYTPCVKGNTVPQENGGFSEVPTQMELTSSALAKQEQQRTEQEMAEVA